MNFDIPDTSVALRDAVRTWADSVAGGPPSVVTHEPALRSLGALDVVGPDSPDPENANLNAALVLVEVAAAGLVGPMMETVWASTYPRPGGEAAGWATCAAPFIRGGETFVPYGQDSTHLIVRNGEELALRAMPRSMPAAVPMQSGHTWIAGSEWASLEDIAPGYAWCMASALTLGYCRRLMTLALRQTRDRTAFGRQLLMFQAPRFALVECFYLIEGLEPAVLDAAWRLDINDPRATTIASLAWLYAREVGATVVRNIHQVMGAASFIDDTRVTSVSGALTTLRATLTAQAAARRVRASWQRQPGTPMSTVLESLAGAPG